MIERRFSFLIAGLVVFFVSAVLWNVSAPTRRLARADAAADSTTDRKSTRLNSSHGYISYAVFCLKKKKNQPTPQATSYVNMTLKLEISISILNQKLCSLS